MPAIFNLADCKLVNSPPASTAKTHVDGLEHQVVLCVLCLIVFVFLFVMLLCCLFLLCFAEMVLDRKFTHFCKF